MAQDYAEHKKRFDFPNDGHWNRDAHAIVVDSLFSHFKTEIIKTDYFILRLILTAGIAPAHILYIL